MENLNLNLPPFYPSQKVIYISDDGFLPKNSEHIIMACRRHSCGCWTVDVGLKINDDLRGKDGQNMECVRHGNKDVVFDFVQYCYADSFAPIEERFISFADVIAKESPLIGIN